MRLVRMLMRLYSYYIFHKVCNSVKIIMLTKTNICSVQNCVRTNTDRQEFGNDKQNVDVAPPEQISADAHE